MADLAGRTSEQGKDYLIGLSNLGKKQIQIQTKTDKNTNSVSRERITNTNTNTELDGDLLSVYGCPAIKYLERPWNKQRAQVTSL